MNAPVTSVSPAARPRLARGVRLTHSEPHGGWVILAPERMLKADAVAVEILKRCNGEAALANIVNELAALYAAPREQIEGDVQALLASLAEKNVIEFRDD